MPTHAVRKYHYTLGAHVPDFKDVKSICIIMFVPFPSSKSDCEEQTLTEQQ
jgi:hypothetical protein